MISKLIWFWIRDEPFRASPGLGFRRPRLSATSPCGEVPQRNHVCCLVSPALSLRRTILSPFSFQGTRCRPAAGSRMLTASPSGVKEILKPLALFHPPARPDASPSGSRDRKELPARLRSGDGKCRPWSCFCQQEKEHRSRRFWPDRPDGRMARSEGGLAPGPKRGTCAN